MSCKQQAPSPCCGATGGGGGGGPAAILLVEAAAGLRRGGSGWCRPRSSSLASPSLRHCGAAGGAASSFMVRGAQLVPRRPRSRKLARLSHTLTAPLRRRETGPGSMRHALPYVRHRRRRRRLPAVLIHFEPRPGPFFFVFIPTCRPCLFHLRRGRGRSVLHSASRYPAPARSIARARSSSVRNRSASCLQPFLRDVGEDRAHAPPAARGL
jgi:hypothetical protein